MGRGRAGPSGPRGWTGARSSRASLPAPRPQSRPGGEALCEGPGLGLGLTDSAYDPALLLSTLQPRDAVPYAVLSVLRVQAQNAVTEPPDSPATGATRCWVSWGTHLGHAIPSPGCTVCPTLKRHASTEGALEGPGATCLPRADPSAHCPPHGPGRAGTWGPGRQWSRRALAQRGPGDWGTVYLEGDGLVGLGGHQQVLPAPVRRLDPLLVGGHEAVAWHDALGDLWVVNLQGHSQVAAAPASSHWSSERSLAAPALPHPGPRPCLTWKRRLCWPISVSLCLVTATHEGLRARPARPPQSSGGLGGSTATH